MWWHAAPWMRGRVPRICQAAAVQPGNVESALPLKPLRQAHTLMTNTIPPIRETLLHVMKEYSGRPGYFQTRQILSEVARRLNLRGEAQEQALLTLWADMHRLGIVATGYNLDNSEAPFCHLTSLGRRTLASLSRDPANPDGYMSVLHAGGPLQAVAESYIEEALAAYNSSCFKAAAVMVGAASESLILDLRDTLVGRLGDLGRKPSSKLSDWRAKTVLDAVTDELALHTKSMPVKLREAFQYTWPAFLQQIRAGRNDAGHPTSIAPITEDAVHASLLIFPELLGLTRQLSAWVTSSLT